MVLGLILVNLVDWDSSVDHGRLDSLFVNDRLDCLNKPLVYIKFMHEVVIYLMDVVMNMLASNDWGDGMTLLSASVNGFALEL